MKKQVIIIGAGISGISAGIYARRSGFDVTILEQHSIPGGMCTSWKRKGYLFEGAVHWFTGSTHGSQSSSSSKIDLHTLWEDVGALNDNIKVRYDDPFCNYEYNGQVYHLYRDLNKLQNYFNEVSPEDKSATKRLVKDIKTIIKMRALMPIMDIKGVKTSNPQKVPINELIQMIPAFIKMNKLCKLSIVEYASQFKHPALRTLLTIVVPDMYNATSLIYIMATMNAGDGGYPEGGSLTLTQRMADTFEKMGGKLLYNSKVEKVIAENSNVTGVSVNGKIMPADAVIVTQETLAAVEQLFDFQPKDKWLDEIRNLNSTVCCFVGIGIRAKLPQTPAFKLTEPIKCGGFSYPILLFYNYTDYEGYAPEGCTTLTTVFIGDSYEFWKKARDEGRYESEKQAVSEQLIHILNEKYPETKGKIDIIDIATPLTYERYTSAWHGAWLSVLNKGMVMPAQCPCMLEQLQGVYFSGHRTMLPGGHPAALESGRRAAQMVCRQFDVIFH